MKKYLKWLKALWHEQPVLISTILPVLVAVGAITTQQSDALKALIGSIVVVVTQVAVALSVRSRVWSPASAATLISALSTTKANARNLAAALKAVTTPGPAKFTPVTPADPAAPAAGTAPPSPVVAPADTPAPTASPAGPVPAAKPTT